MMVLTKEEETERKTPVLQECAQRGREILTGLQEKREQLTEGAVRGVLMCAALPLSERFSSYKAYFIHGFPRPSVRMTCPCQDGIRYTFIDSGMRKIPIQRIRCTRGSRHDILLLFVHSFCALYFWALRSLRISDSFSPEMALPWFQSTTYK